ncbi:uncharacterized protein LOC115920961 [Strongylocentrotus purpuratus]|uniref:Uncharacterized protein n=1 Tax=Strongylocentrotus purpuratus TaxID=7668 RepID=A0A7M7NAL6_STRPU|nr:uncharacterized protein LOC115920961 [Strongylocentrotus purpuratus]
MHTILTHSKVISFSGKSYRKFKECADLWKDVSFGFELENKIAAIAVNCDFDSFELQTEQYSPGASGGGVYQAREVFELQQVQQKRGMSNQDTMRAATGTSATLQQTSEHR